MSASRNKRAIAPAPSDIPADFLIDDGATTRRLLGGIGRSTHFAGMAAGRYSRPIKVSPHKNGWVRARTLGDVAKMIAESAL